MSLLAAGPAVGRPLGPRDALRARLPLLLVVSPPDRALPDEEAIGDWAHVLNEAVRDRSRRITVSRITRAGFRDLLTAPAIHRDYATLFVRPDRTGLWHEDLVLDPPVYEAGFAFLDGASPPGVAGLVPVRVRLR